MNSSTGRTHGFRLVNECPYILLDQEMCAQIHNIITILRRHLFILTPEDMRYELLRLLTFIIYFPIDIGICRIRAYAVAGFYYTREGDYVLCYRCGYGFGNLMQETDDPYEAHRENAPHCDFFHNRRINIPFFPVNEGGLRRSTERTVLLRLVSAGPIPVMPADEVQRNILRFLERRPTVFNGESFLTDVNNVNDLPVPDLRQGRIQFGPTALNIAETSNVMLNEIPLSVNDLGIDLRRDCSHSWAGSEMESILIAAAPNRHTQNCQPHISVRANAGVTQEEADFSTAENSSSDIYRLEESEITLTTNGSGSTRSLQQENSSDGIYNSDRFCNDEFELGCYISNETSIRIRGIMPANLPPHLHICYDVIERSDNENSCETGQLEETRLKTVFGSELNRPEEDTGTGANSEETYIKTSHSAAFSATRNVTIPEVTDTRNETQATKYSQLLDNYVSGQTAKGANDPYCPGLSEAEPVENGISTSKTVDSPGKDSDNSHFKLLPRHNTESITANIPSETHKLTNEAIDSNISSEESHDNKGAESLLDDIQVTRGTLCGIHSVKDSIITADAEHKQTETHGNDTIASLPETQIGEEDSFDTVVQNNCISSQDRGPAKKSLTSTDAKCETGSIAQKETMLKLQIEKEDTSERDVSQNVVEIEKQDSEECSYLRHELERVTQERDNLAAQIKQDSRTMESSVLSFRTQVEEERKTLKQTISNLEGTVLDKSQKYAQLSEKLEKCENDLDYAKQNIEELKTSLGKHKLNMQQKLEEQRLKVESQFSDRLADMDRQIIQAKRDYAEAVQQLERQMSREKERLSATEEHYKCQVGLLQGQRKAVEKERNRMMDKPVYVWSEDHNEQPGKGTIIMPEYISPSLEQNASLVAQMGDSGAIVCMDDLNTCSVHVISMLIISNNCDELTVHNLKS